MHPSEKYAKFAQKLGQLQSIVAVFPQPRYRNARANLHSLGQHNTFLAAVTLTEGQAGVVDTAGGQGQLRAGVRRGL